MSLKDWQTRLDSHYTAVRKIRPTGRPIFGLEHGLSEPELASLQRDIRAEVKTQSYFSSDTYLPWVVYAAEVGYQYSGDEYWQTFEECTPGWQERGDRAWIRNCFVKFSDKYEGAQPTGAWAEHFRIICWPIAHAILPTYLQRQLAELLFDLRLAFRKEHFESPAQLGELLSSQSWSTSSRLQLLLETPLLVGQIAAALLLQDQDASGALVTPATLKRIAADLDHEHRAREWLQTAKSRALTVQLTGLSRSSGGALGAKPGVSTNELAVRRQAETLGIAPQLILRPVFGKDDWAVVLEIPSFAPLRSKCPEYGPALSGSRCFVSGSATRAPLAKGRLLHGTQTIPLARWPRAAEPLLSFEGAPAELEQLLKSECLLTSGPIWLFKVQTDGCAYEIQGKTVRPGQRYIVLTTDQTVDISSLGPSLALSCADAWAVSMDVPQFIPPAYERAIEKIGLALNRGIEAWPTGVPATFWDDEGRAEWTYPDTPRIGFKSDHAIEKLSLILEGGAAPAELEIPGSSETLFVELPDLEPGAYTLKVRPTYQDAQKRSIDALLQIGIREAGRSSREGAGRRAPLAVFLDPLQPTVEQIWQGECALEVAGPRDRSATGLIELLGKEDGKILASRQISMRLPIEATGWRDLFARQVAGDRKIQDHYDSAHKLRITFEGGELGRYSLLAEREFAPLRWVAIRNKDDYRLRLTDDSGLAHQAIVAYASFQEPDKAVLVPAKDALKILEASKNGGLYWATAGEYRRSIVVPPNPQTIDGFAALRLKSKFEERPKTSDSIRHLVQCIEDWASARIPARILAITWSQQVLRELYWYLYYLSCGRAWRDAERLEQQDAAAYAESLIQALGARYKSTHSAMQVLRESLPTWRELPIERRPAKLAWLLQKFSLWQPKRRASFDLEAIARAQKLANPDWFAEFLLRMASRADTLRVWSGPLYDDATEEAIASPEAVGIARIIVLATSRYSKVDDFQAIAKEWEWR